MKRYGMSEICEECKAEHMVEEVHGDYVLYSDVLRETIPRPDADEARRAVEEYGDAVEDYSHCKAEFEDKYLARIKQKKAALLRLMGVE